MGLEPGVPSPSAMDLGGIVGSQVGGGWLESSVRFPREGMYRRIRAWWSPFLSRCP